MSFFQHLKPEDFDTLGIATFTFLMIYSGYELWTGQIPDRAFVIALFVIGFLGLIIDGRIVWHYLIKRDKQ